MQKKQKYKAHIYIIQKYNWSYKLKLCLIFTVNEDETWRTWAETEQQIQRPVAFSFKLSRSTPTQVSLMPKFHYIYLAQTCLKPGLRHVLSRSPTCRRQVRDQKSRGPGLRQDRSISTCRDRSSRSATCLRLFCRKQVLSKIEAVEFRNDKRTFRGSQPISSHLVMT